MVSHSPHVHDIEDDIAKIEKERSRKKGLVIAALFGALLVAIGFTTLMYQDTPSEQPPSRIGTEVFE